MPALIILGNGMAGAYLARLMSLRGEQVVVYGRQHKTACRTRPCGWGFGPGVWGLIRNAGLDPDDYVLSRDRKALIEGVGVPCDLVSMDKPRLIADLLRGIEVRYEGEPESEYVDATGVSAGPLRALCVQARVKGVTACPPGFYSTPGVGYQWIIPLGNGEAHVGFGALRAAPADLWRRLKYSIQGYGVVCACSGTVDLAGPDRHHHWRRGRVGEALGLVNPVTGEGNTWAMRSAALLAEQWPDVEAYNAALAGFGWMGRAAHVVRRLYAGHRLGVRDYPVVLGAFRRSGFYPRVWHMPRLFLKLREGLRA